MARPSWLTNPKAYDRARANGYRSGLEEKVAQQLKNLGIEATYEEVTISYTKPSKAHRYTPDFVLPNGIIIETKGVFTTEDRTKHRLLNEQHPELDIRLVFSNPNSRIGKKSATTYAMWADRIGIPYAKAEVPVEWAKEPANKASLRAIALLRKA